MGRVYNITCYVLFDYRHMVGCKVIANNGFPISDFFLITRRWIYFKLILLNSTWNSANQQLTCTEPNFNHFGHIFQGYVLYKVVYIHQVFVSASDWDNIWDHFRSLILLFHVVTVLPVAIWIDVTQQATRFCGYVSLLKGFLVCHMAFWATFVIFECACVFRNCLTTKALCLTSTKYI